MIIYVDIDNTITIPNSDVDEHGDLDYALSKPRHKNIKKINKLWRDGHTIVYWTARGTLSGKDLRELTIQQLSDWGARYSQLILNKPYYDLYIDDKVINVRDWELLP